MRQGAELFLHERAFEDIIDRLSLIRRRFARALLIGCPNPEWKHRLDGAAERVEIIDPGPAFAAAAGGHCTIEDKLDVSPASYDLCVAIGTLDSVNALPEALARIRIALKSDSLLIGAMAGGGTLPKLRAAMRAADQDSGAASPHVHPRIEASALATLLSANGFAMPVIDIDAVRVAYTSFDDLVRDLRGMGATNILRARSDRPLSRRATAAAAAHFSAAGAGGKTIETFELLHFAAWTPAIESTRTYG